LNANIKINSQEEEEEENTVIGIQEKRKKPEKISKVNKPKDKNDFVKNIKTYNKFWSDKNYEIKVKNIHQEEPVKINYKIPGKNIIDCKEVDTAKYNDINQETFFFQDRFALNEQKKDNHL